MSMRSLWSRGRVLAVAGATCGARARRGLRAPRQRHHDAELNSTRTYNQVQRLGNPLVSEVFLAKKDHAVPRIDRLLTATPPRSEQRVKGFVAAFRPQATTLQTTLATVLLPDMLIVQTDKAPSTAGWLSWALSNGWGGRKLTDDVVDVGLTGIFSDLLDPTQSVCKPFTLPLCTDNVGSHSTFQATFPVPREPEVDHDTTFRRAVPVRLARSSSAARARRRFRAGSGTSLLVPRRTGRGADVRRIGIAARLCRARHNANVRTMSVAGNSPHPNALRASGERELGASEAGEGRRASAPVYIVDGARTPFLKARNRPGPFAASDLATDAGRALLLRQPFAPAELDEVILGCAAPVGRRGEHRPRRRAADGLRAQGAGLDRDAQLRVRHAGARLGDRFDARRPLESRARRRRRCAVARAAAVLGCDGRRGFRTGTRRRRSDGARRCSRNSGSEYLAPVIGLMKGLTDPSSAC